MNAGQVFPLIRRQGRILELKQSSYPLGVRRGTRYERQEMELEAGDLVLLLTDGLFEAAAREGEIYGWDRVVDRFRRTEIDGVEAIVEDWNRDVTIWEQDGIRVEGTFLGASLLWRMRHMHRLQFLGSGLAF